MEVCDGCKSVKCIAYCRLRICFQWTVVGARTVSMRSHASSGAIDRERWRRNGDFRAGVSKYRSLSSTPRYAIGIYGQRDDRALTTCCLRGTHMDRVRRNDATIRSRLDGVRKAKHEHSRRYPLIGMQ
ncbi:hypothetical protein F1559_002838 [Cyanidiococcus yangmingshanensis]|uniref:Uncharacterized protein n=1 Tax=Cyanidiococcus yangmingshanensis TaxID=2690220 RepID=A0A7J7IIB0_9RHOD|nr:hypothetical protein F1559_002838 [Cyanidiococcus yangmingshanensis]